jgi:hypothetical protein
LTLLEAYWPRFLMTHVPPVQVPVARSPAKVPRSPSPDRPDRSAGIIDRLRNLLPQPLRR